MKNKIAQLSLFDFEDNSEKVRRIDTAKSNKKDEFYTRMCDIEKELQYYQVFFKDKTIYCNCDDPNKSNFFKYFADNFKNFSIKKIIATSYNYNNRGLVGVYDGSNISIKELNGNGDFRSDECIEFLKEADVVVTNPPFSLLKEYIPFLMKYDKKFIIIGNLNAAMYSQIFPYVKENKLWAGVTNFNNGMYFYVPDDYEYSKTYKFEKEKDGKKAIRVTSISWFTNLEHKKRFVEFPLKEQYSPEKYQQYSNYNAIEVNNIHKIPFDYYEAMGVPFTFFGRYCPSQFEILENLAPKIGNKNLYRRLIIKRKKNPQ